MTFRQQLEQLTLSELIHLLREARAQDAATTGGGTVATLRGPVWAEIKRRMLAPQMPVT